MDFEFSFDFHCFIMSLFFHFDLNFPKFIESNLLAHDYIWILIYYHHYQNIQNFLKMLKYYFQDFLLAMHLVNRVHKRHEFLKN